jgi:hypothetical protein
MASESQDSSSCGIYFGGSSKSLRTTAIGGTRMKKRILTNAARVAPVGTAAEALTGWVH